MTIHDITITRRIFIKTMIGAFALGMTGLGYTSKVEPFWVEIERVRLSYPNMKKVPRGLRIVQLSDIHRSPQVPDSYIKACIASAMDLKADLILITGDYITTASDLSDKLVELFKPLKAQLGVFAVFGNHDGGAWARTRTGLKTVKPLLKILDKTSIQPLINEARKISYKGVDVVIVGLGDIWAEMFNPDLAYGKALSDDFVISLSHNPDTVEPLRQYRSDLTLCGHTHGGQVNIPLIGAPFVPINDKRYVAGLFKIDDGFAYVNRGIGSIDGIRFNCRPEITLIEIA